MISTADNELADERKILDLIGKKDAAGFDLMVERFAPMLFRYARRMCQNDAEAEDVLQETFLAAQEKIGQFRGEGRLRNWLFSITLNSCRQHQRKARGRRLTELDLDEVLPPAEDAGDRAAVSWRMDPVERMLNAELLGRLEDAIAKVPAPNRAVLILRDLEGACPPARPRRS